MNTLTLTQELAMTDRVAAIVDKFNACIEAYLQKKDTLSNATYLAIFRATEKEIIAAQGLEESRALHNRIRAMLLEV